jgi:hypothetical protein
MAEHPPNFEFEDIPLEEARLMGRAPRMEPLLYDTLRQKIQALSTEATSVRLGPEITQRRMRNYILRIAHELNIPVTIRRVAGGVIFWRATAEERQQAEEVASRLQSARQQRSTQSKGRQRTGTRPSRGRQA